MCELSLAGPELPEGLGNGHGLDTTAKQCIQGRRSRGNLQNLLALFDYFVAGNKHRLFDLAGRLDELFNLSLVDALDVAQLLLGGHANARHCAHSRCLEFRNVGCVDALFLQFVDLGEVLLLELFDFLVLLPAALLHN